MGSPENAARVAGQSVFPCVSRREWTQSENDTNIMSMNMVQGNVWDGLSGVATGDVGAHWLGMDVDLDAAAGPTLVDCDARW